VLFREVNVHRDIKSNHPIKVAVVTGGHSFEVPAFRDLFHGMSGIDLYVQSIENWSADEGGSAADYDVTLFYTMHMTTPERGMDWPWHQVRDALERLGEDGRGIVVLHHALLSYADWPHWDALVGIDGRGKFTYHHDQELDVVVKETDHPITQGLESFQITDESYGMNDATNDSDILLTVDHPLSMTTLGWTREFRESRVLCLELGHDAQAWRNESFVEILRRGLLWCGRRI
jgi:uncharacterized protein